MLSGSHGGSNVETLLHLLYETKFYYEFDKIVQELNTN